MAEILEGTAPSLSLLKQIKIQQLTTNLKIAQVTLSHMTEKSLNNCLLLHVHVHKELTDDWNLTDIAYEFIIKHNKCKKKYFGNLTD